MDHSTAFTAHFMERMDKKAAYTELEEEDYEQGGMKNEDKSCLQQ